MPGNLTAGEPITSDVQSIFQIYREQQFTGVVKLSAVPISQSTALSESCVPNPWVGSWHICFLLGRITWIRSRAHGLRRWQRNLQLYAQALAKQIEQRPDLPAEAWNYSALHRLVKLKKMSSNQLANVIEGVVTENLFDIFQVGALQVKTPQNQAPEHFLCHAPSAKPITDLPPIIINDSRAWREASQEWNDWHRAGLTLHSPDDGLTIVDAESLRQRTSGQIRKVIKTCCNRNRSLRELAPQFRQPTLLLAKSIMPYVAEKLVAFVAVPNRVETVDHGFASALFDRDPMGIEEESPVADKSAADGVIPDDVIPDRVTQKSPLIEVSIPEIESLPTTPSNQSPHQLPTQRPTQRPDSVSGQQLAKPSANPSAQGRQPVETRLEKSVSKLEKSVDKVETLVNKVEPAASVSGTAVTAVRDRITRQKKIPQNKPTSPVTNVQNSISNRTPSIIYIDDSLLDSRTMGVILDKLGCRYNNISDPIQALPMLLEIKPDLIFLDLVMPIANGYEVCAQIRRISSFQKTPIIILTSNDGVADRARAKLVGASGFLGKPIKASKVQKVLNKYLQMPIVIPVAKSVEASASSFASLSHSPVKLQQSEALSSAHLDLEQPGSERPGPEQQDPEQQEPEHADREVQKVPSIEHHKRRRVRDFLFSR